VKEQAKYEFEVLSSKKKPNSFPDEINPPKTVCSACFYFEPEFDSAFVQTLDSGHGNPPYLSSCRSLMPDFLVPHVCNICFCHVLTEAGFRGQRQLDIPIVIDEWLRLDVIVNNLVTCELKALEQAHPLWQAELPSHLKVTEQRLGSLIHFNVPLIKDGIKRMILQLALLQHCVPCIMPRRHQAAMMREGLLCKQLHE
jgi:GxxExxY protein